MQSQFPLKAPYDRVKGHVYLECDGTWWFSGPPVSLLDMLLLWHMTICIEQVKSEEKGLL